MSKRNDNSIIRVEGQAFTFNKLVEHAKKQAHDRPGEFWIKCALVLLRRIYDLEVEAQTLRQGELFAPPCSNAKGDLSHDR